jgi:hypothetical protein
MIRLLKRLIYNQFRLLKRLASLTEGIPNIILKRQKDSLFEIFFNQKKISWNKKRKLKKCRL